MSTVNLSKLTLAISMAALSVSPVMAQNMGRSGGRGGVQVGAGGGQKNQQATQQQIQQIGQQLQQGEKALTDSGETATEARQSWQKADTEHKQNVRDLAQAKKLAEEDAKNAPELTAAKEKLDKLNAERTEVRKKVIEQLLKENEDYQKASKIHEDAVADQKANGGASVAPEVRKELSKKVTEADKSKRAIEDIAMADNSEAKELKKQITEATTELGAASKKKAEAIETDPKLSSAKVAFLRTRDELKKAKMELDQADGAANRIRSTMQGLANQRASLQNQVNQQQRTQQGGNGYQNNNQTGRTR